MGCGQPSRVMFLQSLKTVAQQVRPRQLSRHAMGLMPRDTASHRLKSQRQTVCPVSGGPVGVRVCLTVACRLVTLSIGVAAIITAKTPMVHPVVIA